MSACEIPNRQTGSDLWSRRIQWDCSLCFFFIIVFVVSWVIFPDNLRYPPSLSLRKEGNPVSRAIDASPPRRESTLSDEGLRMRGAVELWAAPDCGARSDLLVRSFVYQHNILKECVLTYRAISWFTVISCPFVNSFASAETSPQVAFLFPLRVTGSRTLPLTRVIPFPCDNTNSWLIFSCLYFIFQRNDERKEMKQDWKSER